MGKLLLWVGLFASIYLAFKVALVLRRKNEAQHKSDGQQNKGSEKSLEQTQLMACAHCGTHLPKEDAVMIEIAHERQFFCSSEHAKLYTNRQ